MNKSKTTTINSDAAPTFKFFFMPPSTGRSIKRRVDQRQQFFFSDEVIIRKHLIFFRVPPLIDCGIQTAAMIFYLFIQLRSLGLDGTERLPSFLASSKSCLDAL